MPTRFVEVTNLADAALKSDPLSYFSAVNLTLNTSRLSWFATNWTAWAGARANGTGITLGGVAAPTGVAKYMILAAALLLLINAVTVRVSARRAVRQHGHTHAE